MPPPEAFLALCCPSCKSTFLYYRMWTARDEADLLTRNEPGRTLKQFDAVCRRRASLKGRELPAMPPHNPPNGIPALVALVNVLAGRTSLIALERRALFAIPAIPSDPFEHDAWPTPSAAGYRCAPSLARCRCLLHVYRPSEPAVHVRLARRRDG